MPLLKALDIGDRIPDFELQDQNGQWIKRDDFKGKPLVIFFYPKDHTPGCTAEACSFRDYESEFQAVGAKVIGINDAEVSIHKSFADKYDLKYPVLSDPGHMVRKSFGAPGLLFDTVANRITYVTDGSHKVAYIFTSLFRANDHVLESLDYVKKWFMTPIEISITLLTFFAMEGVAWAAHKYLMHGILWFLHDDHHTKTPGALEKNDTFFLIFAIPSWLCIMLGLFNGNGISVATGAGIAFYGFAYALVHELFIHQRLPVLKKSRFVYWEAVRLAHKMHHRHLGKENGENFGMLWVHPKYIRQVRQMRANS